MSRRRDGSTPDLFLEYRPAPVVERFSRERVRAAHCAGLIARAVAEAIKESRHNRETIARLMSEHLCESITIAMLDQYSSVANEKNNISAHRLAALFIVTGDIRLINAMLEGTGAIAVHAKYEFLIRREQAKEDRDRAEREMNTADAQWRAGR